MNELTLCVYTFAELAFAYVFTAKRNQLERLVVEQQTSVEQAWVTFNRVFETLRTLSFGGASSSGSGEAWLLEWFIAEAEGATEADNALCHENVTELMAEAFFGRPWQQLREQGLAGEVASMVEALEQRMDTRFPAGRNPRFRMLQQSPAALPCNYRPLFIYAMIEVLSWVNDSMLRAAGYTRFEREDGLVYFTKGMHQRPLSISCTANSSQQLAANTGAAAARAAVVCGAASSEHLLSLADGAVEAGMLRTGASTQFVTAASQASLAASGSLMDSESSSSSSSNCSSSGSLTAGLTGAQSEEMGGTAEALPIVFAHGVGMGLLPYLCFMISLAATGRPILAFEFKHISQRWCRAVPSPNTLAIAMMEVLRQHGYHRAAFVGHSFGTAVLSRVLQAHPASIAHLTLLDPIVFNMFLPGLLRNFMYRVLGAQGLLSLPKDCLLLGVARELHCSASVCRRMDWANTNLYANMVPENCLVVLSGMDELLPAHQLQRWLQDHTPATVMFHPHLSHAALLLDVEWMDQILAAILKATGGAASDLGIHGGRSKPAAASLLSHAVSC
ncbi:MAG: hypothetical protein WDW38_004827 [Sanguina aurantia]